MHHPLVAGDESHQMSPGRPRRPAVRTVDRIAIPFFYVVLVIAAFNTVLRMDVEDSITLYYLITPVIALVLLMLTRWFFSWLIIVSLISVYAVLTARAFGTPQYFYLSQLAFYSFLLCFFGGLNFLRISDPNFSRNIMRMLWFLLAAAFFFAIGERVTGMRLPNLPTTEAFYLIGYFFTANDIALFISAALAVILIRPGHLVIKIVATVGVFVLNIVNDAKAATLAILIIMVVFFASQLTSKLRLPPLVLGGVAALTMFTIIMGGQMIDVQIGGVDFNLYELLAEPVSRIVNLNAYNMAGSIFDRSDALIINLREFIGTNGLGMGPGGSTYVLSLPENRLVTAESMHNGVAELAVEMGLVFIIPFGLWIYRVCSRMLQVQPSRGDLARFAFLCGLPFLAVTQSSGYISNYASWMVVFLFVLAPDGFWGSSQFRRSRPAAMVYRRERMPWETGGFVR